MHAWLSMVFMKVPAWNGRLPLGIPVPPPLTLVDLPEEGGVLTLKSLEESNYLALTSGCRPAELMAQRSYSGQVG